MSEKFKLIVAGTRSFNDYELLRSILSTLFMKRHCWTIDWNEEIVSGGIRGRCNSILGRQEPGDAEHDTANARTG